MRYRAAFPRGEDGEAQLDAVGQRDGDEIARLHAEPPEGPSEAVRCFVERAPADCPFADGEAGPVGIAAGVEGHDPAERRARLGRDRADVNEFAHSSARKRSSVWPG